MGGDVGEVGGDRGGLVCGCGWQFYSADVVVGLRGFSWACGAQVQKTTRKLINGKGKERFKKSLLYCYYCYNNNNIIFVKQIRVG
jgi:hypothetical protein